MRLKKLESKSRDEEPFLRSGKGLELDPVRSSRCAPLSNRFAVVHIVTIILNVILAITLFSFIQGCGYPPDHGFAREAIRYKKTMFIPSSESPWSGRHTPEIDDSWGKLLDNASICVSDDELLKLNETSIDLQERRGKLAWLEVSHQIHCVQYVRKAIYRSYYYPEITDQDWEDFMQPHIEHCLNDLLQTVMCHGDSTLKLFEWEEERVKPVITPNYRTPRTCVDLDYLKDSLADRVVSHKEMRRLKNPLLQ